MAPIPNFLLQRVLKKGSLRQNEEGVAFDLKNVLGPGVISGLNYIIINDIKFTKEVIKFITGGLKLSAQNLSEENPVNFRLNQEGTLLLEKATCLKQGLNKIIIELLNPEAGKIQVELKDNFNPA